MFLCFRIKKNDNVEVLLFNFAHQIKTNGELSTVECWVCCSVSVFVFPVLINSALFFPGAPWVVKNCNNSPKFHRSFATWEQTATKESVHVNGFEVAMVTNELFCMDVKFLRGTDVVIVFLFSIGICNKGQEHLSNTLLVAKREIKLFGGNDFQNNSNAYCVNKKLLYILICKDITIVY